VNRTKSKYFKKFNLEKYINCINHSANHKVEKDKVNKKKQKNHNSSEINKLFIMKENKNVIKYSNALNKSHNLFYITKKFETLSHDHILKYQINKGNNSNLVKTVFSSKNIGWKYVDRSSKDYDFKWEMWSKNIHFNCLSLRKPQIVNHYEFNSELTTKDKLFLNMNEFCESNKSNVFDYLSLTFVFDTSSKDYCNFLQQFFQIFRSLEQIENTEQGSSINKANKIISFFYPTKPKSFTKPKLWDSQIGSNIWIIKPTGFNRGRGVSVFSDLITLKKLINEFVGNEETNYFSHMIELNKNRF